MILARGAVSQLFVVHALILRETRTRFGAHQLGYLWALLEPVIWILTFYALFVLGNRSGPDGMDTISFLATGIIPFELFSKTYDRGSLSISANRAMLFYPQVQPLDLVYARSILESATFVTVFLIVVGGNALVQGDLTIDSALRVVLGLALAGTLGMAFGLVLCSLSVVSNSVDRVKGPLLRPMFWVSGLFFTANSLPKAARDILLWNPVLHCVELVRDGMFPSYQSRYASISYVLIWIVSLLFIGLTLERGVRSKVQLS